MNDERTASDPQQGSIGLVAHRFDTRLLSPHARPGVRQGPPVAGAEGTGVLLEDGRRVLDFAGSAGILGHRHPELINAIKAAADGPLVGEAHAVRQRERAADQLLDVAFQGEEWAAGVRFCTSASDAIDLALALAQTLTGREPLVVRGLSYHGANGLARAASTYPLWGGGIASESDWRHPSPSVRIRSLPVPRCASLGEEPSCTASVCTAGGLEGALEVVRGAAAVLFDYGSGAIYPCASYQDSLVSLAEAADAVFVQDEAVTGFGRIGKWFAFQRGTSRPDLVALGKGITAGYAPGGALVVSRRVLDLIGDSRWLTFSTWRGHSLTLAALMKTLEVIDRDGLIQRAQDLGTRMATLLTELRAEHAIVERIAGEGLSWNIELRGPEYLHPENWHGEGSGPTPASLMVDLSLKQGLLIRAKGALGFFIFPPFTATESELDTAVDVLNECLSLLERPDAASILGA